MSLVINEEPLTVFSVHWKRRERFPDETFNTIRNISIKYPLYKEEFLNKHFEGTNEKFEDSELSIQKALIRYEPDEQSPKPSFPKVRFWEYRLDEMNWIKSYRTVIQRILERGPVTEWQELIRYYGLAKVSNVIRNEILDMPDYTIKEVCDFFKFKKEELLCYIRKQSKPKHWI
jgi:hypothetical protein